MDLNGDGKHDWKDQVLFQNLMDETSSSSNSGGYYSSGKYKVKSANPVLVSDYMLKNALYMVSLRNGPEAVLKFKKCAITMVIDSANRRLLAVWGGTHQYMFEIPFSQIRVAVCIDSHQKKEDRHKFQIITMSGEVYDFNADNPYLFDPLSFLNSLNYTIDCQRHPESHKYDTLKGVAGIVVFVIIIGLVLGLLKACISG